jgi:hypothetical protein
MQGCRSLPHGNKGTHKQCKLAEQASVVDIGGLCFFGNFANFKVLNLSFFKRVELGKHASCCHA